MTTSSRLDIALNNYFNIFEMLLRMRQCVDLPDSIAKKKIDNQQLTSFAESAVSNIGIALMMNVERPHCRPFTVLTFQYIFNGMDEWSSSTKIEAVVEELSKLCHEDKTANRYEAGLLSSPIHFGDVALHFLMTKPTFAVVFLISFKVGGVALNLAKAI